MNESENSSEYSIDTGYNKILIQWTRIRGEYIHDRIIEEIHKYKQDRSNSPKYVLLSGEDFLALKLLFDSRRDYIEKDEQSDKFVFMGCEVVVLNILSDGEVVVVGRPYEESVALD